MISEVVKIQIYEQDLENLNYYCKIINENKSKIVTLILKSFMEDYLNFVNLKNKIIKDINLGYNYDYSKGLIWLNIRIEKNIWNNFNNFCNLQNINKSVLINILINRFLYLDFPELEKEEPEVCYPIKFIEKNPFILNFYDQQYSDYNFYIEEKDVWKIDLSKPKDVIDLNNFKSKWKFVYNNDGSLKYKVNLEIEDNQAFLE